MTTHRINFSRSPATVRVAPRAESFVRETGPAAMEIPIGGSAGANEDQHSAAALEKLTKEHEQALREATQAMLDEIGELEMRRQQSIGELRELAVELACAITTHVVEDALTRDQFPLVQLIDRAIEHLGIAEPNHATFKLNPDDCRVIERAWNEADQDSDLTARVTLHPDPTLARGSCEATFGDRGIVVDVHDQLNQIRHELLGILDNAQTERRDAATSDRQVQRYPNRRDTA